MQVTFLSASVAFRLATSARRRAISALCSAMISSAANELSVTAEEAGPSREHEGMPDCRLSWGDSHRTFDRTQRTGSRPPTLAQVQAESYVYSQASLTYWKCPRVQGPRGMPV